MAIDLTSKLLKPGTDQGELESSLGTFFTSSSQPPGNRVIHGGKLAIDYGKKKQIRKIELLDNSDTALADELINGVENLIYSDHGFSVCQRYIFSGLPIKGFIRIHDDFQIAPLPETSPRPNQSLADHPGLLEFSYKKSPSFHVEIYRKEKREQELILLLRALLGNGFYGASDLGKKEWSLIRPDKEILKFKQWAVVKKSTRMSSEFIQTGYVPGDLWPQKDSIGFSVDKSWEAITSFSTQDFYALFPKERTDRFIVPETFEQSYNFYNSLSVDNQNKYLRSAHWYKASSEVFGSSRSLAFAVLVFAIETLMPPGEAGEECKACGVPERESISQRFRNFLDTYCSGLSSQHISDFVSMRSKFVHGGSLMLSDAEATGFRFTAPINEEREHYRVLSHICRIAMLNWLHDQGYKSKR